MGWLHSLFAELATNLPLAFASLCAGVLVDLAHRLQKWHKKRSKKIKAFAASIEDGRNICSLLDQARDTLGAMDIYVGALHNGGELLSGKSIMRITRMYERPAAGIVPQGDQFVGDMLSSLPGEMELTIDKGASFTLVANLPVGKLRWIMEQGGRVAIARCMMSKGDQPLGYVGVDFRSEKPPENLEAVMADVSYRVCQIFMRY